jgi:hypothetical protein
MRPPKAVLNFVLTFFLIWREQKAVRDTGHKFRDGARWPFLPVTHDDDVWSLKKSGHSLGMRQNPRPRSAVLNREDSESHDDDIAVGVEHSSAKERATSNAQEISRVE